MSLRIQFLLFITILSMCCAPNAHIHPSTRAYGHAAHLEQIYAAPAQFGRLTSTINFGTWQIEVVKYEVVESNRLAMSNSQETLSTLHAPFVAIVTYRFRQTSRPVARFNGSTTFRNRQSSTIYSSYRHFAALKQSGNIVAHNAWHLPDAQRYQWVTVAETYPIKTRRMAHGATFSFALTTYEKSLSFCSKGKAHNTYLAVIDLR